LGSNKSSWLNAFHGADFVVCRLTPEKYHYNPTPVAGVVRDFYENDGNYHSCNPGPFVSLATPYSKNKRVVTVIDTDVSGGTAVGLVAMIEVARSWWVTSSSAAPKKITAEYRSRTEPPSRRAKCLSLETRRKRKILVNLLIKRLYNIRLMIGYGG
jgi:phosphatidylserine decarboxylase